MPKYPFTPSFINDKDFIIKVCASTHKQDRHSRENRGIISFMTDQYNLDILFFMADELKSDHKFILQLINEYNIPMLRYCADKYSDDETIVSLSLEKDGMLLRYASNRLRKDSKICKIAVEENGSAIEYCINATNELIKISIRKTRGRIFTYLSEGTRSDYNIIVYTLSFTTYKNIINDVRGIYYNSSHYESKKIVLKQYMIQDKNTRHNIVHNFYLVMKKMKDKIYEKGIHKLINEYCDFSFSSYFLPILTKALNIGFS